MTLKALNDIIPLIAYLILEINVRILLLLTFLAGCSNIEDNTTLGDKVIIGTGLAIIAYGGATLGEW